jgi:hypothetical protein
VGKLKEVVVAEGAHGGEGNGSPELLLASGSSGVVGGEATVHEETNGKHS